MTRIAPTLVLATLALLPHLADADQGSLINSGGSGTVGAGVYVTSTVANPAGTLTLTCPTISTGQCAGGSYAFSSNDGTISIAASFTSGSYAEGCSGGGKGGHITCSFSFSGYFSGTWTVNGQAQALVGVTYQAFGTGGAAAQGISAFNSAYAPFYYSDSEQIHRSDDLLGTNQISYGGQGGDAGNFYGAYGIALDSAGRIYVADTYNCRVVRIDDMNGTNWISYGGTCGSGQGQFYDPSGIAVDSAGKIYIMDTGNSRLVRIDNMTGTNWVTFGSVGSGVGQFTGFTSVTVDAAGHIYIPDTGNLRIVRMDDMTGANWTVLSQSQPVNGYSYTFQSPSAVAVDSAGKIYIADNQGYQPAVIRVDDMTGANWTSIYTGAGSGLNSISVDAGGSVFTGGGGARIVDNMTAVLTSSGNVGPIGSYYVFGVTSIPLPTPHPSAIRYSPDTLDFSQNVGSSSSQTITVTNFGGSPLHISNLAANGGFTETDTCLGTLTAGSACTVTVSFAPTVTGPASALLTVTDDSGNAGGVQSVILTGTGTVPVATVTPASLNFQSQVQGTTSNPRNVVVQNTGTGPLQVTSVVALAPFSQTNTCTASIDPGFSCTIQVSFTPTAIGQATGTLTISDNAGTQTVSLSGTGVGQVTLSSSSLNFGALAVGETSTARTVTLTNRGTMTLSFSSIATAAPFAIASNTCGASIAAGANCTVGVTFSPTATGAASGTLTFTDDAPNNPQIVTLTGTGSVAVTLSSSSLSFSAVVGSTSSARSVSLTNHENVALHFTSISTTAGFAIATNTCGASIAGGVTCNVGVTFSPTVTGTTTGTLTFTDDAANSPQTVTLTGTGNAPVTLSATTLNFNSVTVGTTSSARNVTLTNRQSVALHFAGVATTAGFAITTNTCGASIAAGATCTVAVTFSPTVTGPATGTLTFTDDAPNTPQIVTLTGTGR